jgi:hypothetical protein
MNMLPSKYRGFGSWQLNEFSFLQNLQTDSGAKLVFYLILAKVLSEEEIGRSQKVTVRTHLV